MRTGKPDHLRAFDYIGLHRYSLTFCTFGRQRIFLGADHVAEVLTHFVQSATHERFALPAYCFMPAHVHLLIEAQADDSDCRAFIRRAKQFSGFYFKKRFGLSLWQRYGYEHVLRDDEATLAVARYIFNNPVRAGLANEPGEYPFLGSGVHSVSEILEAIQFDRRRSG